MNTRDSTAGRNSAGNTGRVVGSGALLAVVLAVLRHPSLWPVALRQAHRMAPVGWWKGFPPLPLPSPDYLRFRLVTAYGGDGSATPSQLSHDVVAYLRWCAEGLGAPGGLGVSDGSGQHGKR